MTHQVILEITVADSIPQELVLWLINHLISLSHYVATFDSTIRVIKA